MGAGLDDGDGLGVAVLGDEEGFFVGFVTGVIDGVAHGHGFGGGGGFVEERGVDQRQAGEVGDHGLEVEEGFEAALRNLGLVGRVLGIPAGVFKDVALDDGRSDGAVVAHANEGAEDFVLVGQGAELGEGLGFGLGGGRC